jgi:hypothetical protein
MECIQKLQSITDKVIVVTLKGNHDTDPVFHLGVLLTVAYQNSAKVEVHSTRHQRKYFQYGLWGFGFGHGDKEKSKLDRIPLWFAQEAKDIWYRTEMRELFLGDIHHKEEYRFQRASDGIGVYVSFLRSSAGTDQWHSDNGWIGNPKSIEAYVYNKTSGRKNVVSVSW